MAIGWRLRMERQHGRLECGDLVIGLGSGFGNSWSGSWNVWKLVAWMR